MSLFRTGFGFFLIALAVASPTQLRPDSIDIYDEMRREVNNGQWVAGMRLADEIIARNPSYPFAWMCRGWGLKHQGRFADAIPCFERAFNLGATHPGRIQYEIAQCYAELERKEECMNALQLSLDNKYTSRSNFRRQTAFEPYHGDERFRSIAGMPGPEVDSLAEKRAFDVMYLVEEVLRLHPNPYQLWTRQEWNWQAAQLAERSGELTEDQFIVELKRLLRHANDGHTGLAAPYELYDNQVALPLLFSHYPEGVMITATDAEHRHLIWGEVTAVDSLPIKTVMRRVEPYLPRDNDNRLTVTGPTWLRYPQLLSAIGVAAQSDRVSLTVMTQAGEEIVETISLSAQRPERWVRAPGGRDDELPTHFLRRTDFYSADYLPRDKALWIHYNVCFDADDVRLPAFTSALDRFIRENPVESLVLDMRWNGGGDNFRNVPIMDFVMRHPELNKPDRCFLLVSRHTFSAALCLAAQLERFAGVTIVGEPTSSPPNFIGESIPISLPGTGLEAIVSNTFWQNGAATDFRTIIPPKIYAPFTFKDYVMGRDAAMEAIFGLGFEEGIRLVPISDSIPEIVTAFGH